MATETTYTKLRQNLSSVLDQVVDDQEVVIVVRRKNARDVALVPASELASLTETAYLLRSPENARRLLAALRRAERGEGKVMTIEQLRRSVGLGPETQRVRRSSIRNFSSTCITGSRQTARWRCGLWIWWRQFVASRSKASGNPSRCSMPWREVGPDGLIKSTVSFIG